MPTTEQKTGAIELTDKIKDEIVDIGNCLRLTRAIHTHTHKKWYLKQQKSSRKKTTKFSRKLQEREKSSNCYSTRYNICMIHFMTRNDTMAVENVARWNQSRRHLDRGTQP